MQTECEKVIDRLRSWEETRWTKKPVVCYKHAENVIKGLRTLLSRKWPEELEKYDSEKPYNKELSGSNGA